MDSRSFSLTPFPSMGAEDVPGDVLSRFGVTGAAGRFRDRLAVDLELAGEIGRVVVPRLRGAEAPERRAGLWEHTCFEFFVGEKGSSGYWEFNLSPAGHWNVYQFTDYRQGMREETAFASLPFTVGESRDRLSVVLVVDLGGMVRRDREIEVGISAVIEHGADDGEGCGISYWALAHTGPRPDFHRRAGFILSL